MTVESFLFWAFAVVACTTAVAVVVSQNIVRMAFWLVISLGSVAGLFFLAHADLVGATQLLIYVGGTVVLLVFGVMLTASGPFIRIRTSPGEGILGAVIGILFLMMILATAARVDWQRASARLAQDAGSKKAAVQPASDVETPTARPIGLALMGLRPDKDLGTHSGRMSTGYLLVFEIASVHLLVVLIGAAYLARAKRRVDQSRNISQTD